MELTTTNAEPEGLGRKSMIACMVAISWAMAYSIWLTTNGNIGLGLMMLIDAAVCILLLTDEGGEQARAFCLGTIPAGTIIIGMWLT